MIISFSGHRPQYLPDKETGYLDHNPMKDAISIEIRRLLSEYKPEKIISGGAVGIDQMAAEIAIELNIPFVMAIPHIDQERFWPEASKKCYHILLKKAQSVIVVSEGGYAAWKMQARNQYLVDNCDLLIAFWRGIAGGTANCIEYAKKSGREMIVVNPDLLVKNNG
jgi:uncharacterized phage-like protein YoqJ